MKDPERNSRDRLPCPVHFSPVPAACCGGAGWGRGWVTKVEEEFLWYFTEGKESGGTFKMGFHSLPGHQTQRSMDHSLAEVSGSNVETGKFSSNQHRMVREGHLSLWFLPFQPCEKQQQTVSQDIRDKSIYRTNKCKGLASEKALLKHTHISGCGEQRGT